MSIRCIYTEEPNFPATDQHPDALRYKVGPVWVDAVGGEPTQADVDAVLTPPPDYRVLAMTALQESDLVAIRCFKAGISFPPEWQAYVLALRSVLNTGSTLPVRPSYPAGT
jgi:hypothetical protein